MIFAAFSVTGVTSAGNPHVTNMTEICHCVWTLNVCDIIVTMVIFLGCLFPPAICLFTHDVLLR